MSATFDNIPISLVTSEERDDTLYCPKPYDRRTGPGNINVQYLRHEYRPVVYPKYISLDRDYTKYDIYAMCIHCNNLIDILV